MVRLPPPYHYGPRRRLAGSASPGFRLADVLSDSPATFELDAAIRPKELRVVLSVNGRRREEIFRLSPGLLWAAVLPFDPQITGSTTWLNAGWLAFLFLGPTMVAVRRPRAA